VPVDSKADGSVRSAIRWGLLLAAVATFGFRLPRLANEFRAWRGSVRLGDALAAESWRNFLAADSIGLSIVLAFGLVIFFVLGPRRKDQP
jgi:hypothetical protein